MRANSGVQMTVKVSDGNAPVMLKALLLPVRMWACIERVKCRLLNRTPCQIDVNVSIGGGIQDL